MNEPKARKRTTKPSGQCGATLRSRGATFFCTLDRGHEDEHFNDGPLTWWWDDREEPEIQFDTDTSPTKSKPSKRRKP